MAFIFSMVDEAWTSALTLRNAIYMNASNAGAGPALGTAASRLLRLDNDGVFQFDVDIKGKTRVAGGDINSIFMFGTFDFGLSVAQNLTADHGKDFTESIISYLEVNATAPWASPIQVYGMDAEGIIGTTNTTNIDAVFGISGVAGSSALSGNISRIQAQDGYVYNYSVAGTVSNIYAGHYLNQIGASSITTNAYGGYYSIDLNDTAVITTAIGLYVANTGISSGTPTLHNNYGLYIGDQSGIGDTLNYNIYSAGDGENYFNGLVRTGNFNTQGVIVFAPGDPLYADPVTLDRTEFVDNSYYSGDLSAADISSFKIYTGTKHTGAGSININVFDIAPGINSDSTGPVNAINTYYVGPFNAGDGAVAAIYGLYFQPAQFGDGTVSSMTGFYTAPYIDNSIGTATVGSIYGIQITTPQVVGTPTISGNYGIYVHDQSGIAATNYNIYSAGDSFSFNAFRGIVGAGNVINSDNIIYAPNDPINETLYSYSIEQCCFSGNSNSSGDLSGVSVTNFPLYSSIKHTGAGAASLYTIDFEPVVNSDSTGPIGAINAGYIAPINYGQGAVQSMVAFNCNPNQFGDGTITNMMGAYINPYIDDSAGAAGVTGLYGIYLAVPNVVGSPPIVNNYGLYIQDQSAIGSILNYNIYSAGDGYNNLLGVTTIGASTFPATGLDPDIVRLFIYSDRDVGGFSYSAFHVASKAAAANYYCGADVTFGFVPFGSNTETGLFTMGAEVADEAIAANADFFFFDIVNNVYKMALIAGNSQAGTIKFGAMTNILTNTTFANGMFLAIDGTSGNLKVGDTAARGTTEGTSHIDLFNCTAPVGTLTNGISLFSAGGVPMSMDATGFYSSIIPKTGPTANTSAATTITNGADSATNLGHRIQYDFNGTTYWIPCGVTAF